MAETDKQRERSIYRVTIMGGVVNMLLLVFKFLAGVLGHSAAMIADAVHSAIALPTMTMTTDTANMRRWQPCVSGWHCWQ